MFARINQGRVAQVTEDRPELAPEECAHIEPCGPEVRECWLWTPEGFLPPPEPTPEEINAGIATQILALEVKQARPLREYAVALATANAADMQAALERIQTIDAEIAVLRAQRVAS